MMQDAIAKVALSIRTLTMDAVQKANSGHPGLPMGCAELGALIFGELLKHYPQNPTWANRDRFILSAGHGSILLYSLLHLSGYNLSLEDIKDFRQLESKTPGHPEKDIMLGIETTTGPLGQGIANAVGMALAERMLASQFNTQKHTLIDHNVYVLAGDGDIMEGVSAEAASLAGHLKLGKLIVFYDSNKITIDGSTAITFTEDVLARFNAYGWQTLKGSAYDIDGILKLVAQAKKETTRPTIIMLESTIAKGSVNLAGSHKAHGAALGAEEIACTKKALGLPEDEMFYIAEEAKKYFSEKRESWEKLYREWMNSYEAWQKENPELASRWRDFFTGYDINKVAMPEYKVGDKLATRASNGQILNDISKVVLNLVGGSADLAGSNKTTLKERGNFQATTPQGRNINFGVREHAMGALVNGIALYGGLRPFCATFLVFSDYMRPPIRLAALMKLPVVYIFTHDSIFVGEDGPTHQPVEHLAALRAIPGLSVFRPGDAQENVEIWKIIYNNTKGPSALALTRQGLEVYNKEDPQWQENIKKGAYIVKDSKNTPRIVIVASGSEVGLALEVAAELKRDDVRVVSMPCRELFLKQPSEYRDVIIPPESQKVAIEAGVSLGWRAVAGIKGLIISIERFGASGPAKELASFFGLEVKQIVAKIKNLF